MRTAVKYSCQDDDMSITAMETTAECMGGATRAL